MRASVLRQVVILIGLAFLPAIGQALYFRGHPGWQKRPADSSEVTLAQTKKWGAMVLWVDARPNEEFARGHIPGALALNEDDWNGLLPQVLAAWSPERKLVVYCSRKSCNASHAVAERLRHEAGLKNVDVLPGGWEEWKENAPR
ncbi:MAG: rhodanese-like domain-containing protein [Chthoniobacterales bacterium]|nr:rhodanese-like domain-containing protein [Chthoniobacterales bacterium]